jgi:hypothetical protein
VTDPELIREGRRLSGLLDESLRELVLEVHRASTAEREYRKLQCAPIPQAPAGTVIERKAWLDSECADSRYTRDLADGLRQAALETVRSRRAQLSLLQSLLAGEREEMALARTGPS